MNQLSAKWNFTRVPDWTTSVDPFDITGKRQGRTWFNTTPDQGPDTGSMPDGHIAPADTVPLYRPYGDSYLPICSFHSGDAPNVIPEGGCLGSCSFLYS